MSSDEKFRAKLYLGYEGTAHHGWQRQKNREATIQARVEDALSRVCGERIICVASGRTDAGVHARVQVAHADLPVRRRNLVENGRLSMALNSQLPGDIRLYRSEIARPGFHAQRDVRRKTYLYFIDASPVPQPSARRFAWSLRLPLDWKAMEEATRALQGTHDFAAFCDSDASTKTTVRTLFEARWGRAPGMFGGGDVRVLRLTGNGFLKHMVRSITGTLVKVGGGGVDPGLVARSLKSPERSLVGPTAPPHGLWLWDILYLT